MIPNEVLRDRIRGKSLSDRRFADVAGVSLKTVQRWLADIDHKVREDNARRAADVLDCTPHDLWPQQYARSSAGLPSTDRARPFMPTVYPTRTVASESWCKSTGRFAASSSVYGLGNSGEGACPQLPLMVSEITGRGFPFTGSGCFGRPRADTAGPRDVQP
jgi:transcriptional regulator with XRE-family HTH domain